MEAKKTTFTQEACPNLPERTCKAWQLRPSILFGTMKRAREHNWTTQQKC